MHSDGDTGMRWLLLLPLPGALAWLSPLILAGEAPAQPLLQRCRACLFCTATLLTIQSTATAPLTTSCQQHQCRYCSCSSLQAAETHALTHCTRTGSCALAPAMRRRSEPLLSSSPPLPLPLPSPPFGEGGSLTASLCGSFQRAGPGEGGWEAGAAQKGAAPSAASRCRPRAEGGGCCMRHRAPALQARGRHPNRRDRDE